MHCLGIAYFNHILTAMQDQQFLAQLLFAGVEELPFKAQYVVQLCMDNAAVNLAAATIFQARYSSKLQHHS